jgi:beta-lactam-binding protein with PASTA domain
MCIVPRVIGFRLEPAKLAIRHGNCNVGRVRYARAIRRNIGRVIGQVPRGGAQRRIGTRVNLVMGRR